MCIVAIKPAGTPRPTDEQFINMCQRNPDGFGMVTWDKKKGLEVKKTMSQDQYLKWVKQVGDDTPAIFHMRIATHGSVKKKNCHPFIADDKSWAFAHNGILSIANEKDMTDSETFFRRIAMPLIKAEHTPGSATFDAMVATLIDNSKFAFINDEGELFSYGNYIDDGGILYSNSSYQTPSWNFGITSFYPDTNPFSGNYKSHGKKNDRQYLQSNYSYEPVFSEFDYSQLVDDIAYAMAYDTDYYDGVSAADAYDWYKDLYAGLDLATFTRAFEEAIEIVDYYGLKDDKDATTDAE